jgi:hypothetical protein
MMKIAWSLRASSAVVSLFIVALTSSCVAGQIGDERGASGSALTRGLTAFTAVYGADGNDFYRFTGASSVASLKTSGWNTLFLFAASVQSNGDITAGGSTLASNGVYLGDPNWRANIAALKAPPTTVYRYEVTVGGWGDQSYNNIRALVGSQGTGPGSILYRNFQALKNAVPGIDAINDDDEQTYDLSSSTAFGQMLNGLDMKLTQAPYMNQSFWVQLKNNLGAGCDVVYLQCYEGGAGNDPGQWDAAYGNGFHVIPGQESNDASRTQWAQWRSSAQVGGGFYYPDVTWTSGTNWGPGDITVGLGLPAKTVEPAHAFEGGYDDGAINDWDYGYWKADCGGGSVATGLSQRTDFSMADAVLCAPNGLFTGAGRTTVTDASNGDHRRLSRAGDWDVGYYKSECGSNEYVSGVSMNPSTKKLHGLSCASASLANGGTNNCETHLVTQDDRGDSAYGDWDPGAYKGQCSPGKVIYGVSTVTTTGTPHRILCCSF